MRHQQQHLSSLNSMLATTNGHHHQHQQMIMPTNQNHIVIDDGNRPKQAESYRRHGQSSDQDQDDVDDDDDAEEEDHQRLPQESGFCDSASRLAGQQQQMVASAASGGCELRRAAVGGHKGGLPRNTGKLFLAAIVHCDSLPMRNNNNNNGTSIASTTSDSCVVIDSNGRQQQVDRNNLASNCDEHVDLTNKTKNTKKKKGAEDELQAGGSGGGQSDVDNNNTHNAKQRSTTTTLAKLGKLFTLNKRTASSNNDNKSKSKSRKRTVSSSQQDSYQERVQQDADLIDSSQKCKTATTTMMMNSLPPKTTRGSAQQQRGDCAIQNETTSTLPPDLSVATSVSSATETGRGGPRVDKLRHQQQGKSVIEFKFDLIVEGDGGADEEESSGEEGEGGRQEEEINETMQNKLNRNNSGPGRRRANKANEASDDEFLRPIKQRKLLDSVNELVESFVLDSIDACLMSTGRRHLNFLGPDLDPLDELNDELDYIFQLAKLSLTYAFQLLLATKRTATTTATSTETTATTAANSDDQRHLRLLPPPPPALDASDDDCSIELEAILFNQMQGPNLIEIMDLLSGDSDGHRLPATAPVAIDCRTIEEAQSALQLIRGNVAKQFARQRQEATEHQLNQSNRLLMISLKLKQVINGGSFSNRMCLINLSEPSGCELGQIFESIFNGQALAHLKSQQVQLEILKRRIQELDNGKHRQQQQQQQETTATSSDETSPGPLTTLSSGSEFELHYNLKHHQMASLTRLIQAEWLIYKQLSAALIKSLVIVHCHRLQSLAPQLVAPGKVGGDHRQRPAANLKAQFESYLMDYNLSMLEFARTIQRASSSRLRRRRRHLRHGAHLNSATNLSLVSDTNLSLDDLSPPHDRLATTSGRNRVGAHHDLLISTPFRRPHLGGGGGGSSSAALRHRAACLECRLATGAGSGTGDDDDESDYNDGYDSGDYESDGHSGHLNPMRTERDYDLNSLSLAANSCKSRLSSQQHLHQFSSSATNKYHRRHRNHYHGHYQHRHERAHAAKDSYWHHHGTTSSYAGHHYQQQQLLRYNSIGNRRVPHHHHHHHRHHRHHNHHHHRHQQANKAVRGVYSHDDEQDVLSIDASTYEREHQVKSQASTLASKRRRQSDLTETGGSLTPSTSSGSQRGAARRHRTNETLTLQSSSSSNAGGGGGDLATCSSGGAGTSTTLTIASYLLNHQRQMSQMSQELSTKDQISANNHNNNNLSDTEDSLASANLNSYSSQSYLGRFWAPLDASNTGKVAANLKQALVSAEGAGNNRCLGESNELKRYNARAKLQILQKHRLDSPTETLTSIDSPPSIELQSFSSNNSSSQPPAVNLTGGGSAPGPSAAAATSTFTKFTIDMNHNCDDRGAPSIMGGGGGGGKYCSDHQSSVSTSADQTIADQGLLMDDSTSDICSVVAEPPRQLKLEEFLNQLSSVIAPNKGVVRQQQQNQLAANKSNRLTVGSEEEAGQNEAMRQQGTANVDEDDDDCKSHSSILDHLSSLTLESNLKLRNQLQESSRPKQLFAIGNCLNDADYVIDCDSPELDSSRSNAAAKGRVNIVDNEQATAQSGQAAEPVVGGHLQQLLKSTLQLQNSNNLQFNELNNNLLKHKIQTALTIDCDVDRQHQTKNNSGGGLSAATIEHRFEASPNQTPATFTPTSTDSNGSASSSSATSSLSIGTRGQASQGVASIHAHSSTNAMNQLYSNSIRQHT